MRTRLHTVANAMCWMALAVLAGGCGTVASLRPPVDMAAIAGLERSTTVRWASPLYGGAPRALVVLPRGAVRDARELALRVDMASEVIPIDAGSGTGEDGAPYENLLRALEDPLDLIVVANLDLAAIPQGAFERIREKVREGTGLLLANHHGRGNPAWFQEFLGELAPVESALPITRGIAASMTPEWQGGLDFVQAGTYGDGRVVQLNYPGRGPAYHALLPELSQPDLAEWAHYETYWSLVAKAVLWAAHREPSLWIDRIQEEAERDIGFGELPPGMTEAEMREYQAAMDSRILRSYRLYLNSPAEETCEVMAQLRQPGRQWRTEFLQKGEFLKPGEGTYVLGVPAVPGDFYLDAWVKRRGKVIDWHSVPATIAARPYFNDLRAGRDVVLPNDTVRFSFELLPSQRTEDGLRRCVVVLRGTDGFGRKVAYGTQDAPGARRPFAAALEVADLISSRLTVECLLVAHPAGPGDVPEFRLAGAGGTRIPLGVRLPGPAHPFGLAVANHGSQEYGLRVLNERLAGAGVTHVAAEASRDAARFVPETGQTPVFLLSRHWTPRDIETLAGEGDVPAGAPLSPVLETLARDVREVQLGVADAFVLGGGNGLTETYEAVWASPPVLQEFRDRLWAEFGEPAALGEAWAARFPTWDALTLDGLQKAAGDGFFEPWMRFSRHVDTVFLRLFALAREAVETAEPDAPVGFSMMTPSGDGISALWSESAAAAGFLALPPDQAAMARARAFRAPDSVTVLQAPGAVSAEEARWWPWHAVLNGQGGLWWNFAAGPESVVEEAAGVDPVFAELATQASAVRAGFADLFLRAEPANRTVVVYDSRASERLRGARKAPSRPVEAALELLRVLGFPVELAASAESRPEAFEGCQCLILPDVAVLSDVEAERIRAFVESGGVALADTPPGVFDELGRPRTNPPLSDLFTGWTPQEAQPASAEGSEAGASSETGPRAFLLNRSFGEEPAVDIRTAVEDVLGRAGCAPAFRIDSDTAFDGERFRYRFGEAELFAALTSPTRAGRAKYRIAIPESACVYDLWTGLEVRRPGRIAWRAAAGEVALFSALPYRVTEVHAVAPNTVRPGTRLNVAVEIRAEERAPGTHLVHVQLRPLGRPPLPCYDKTLVCEAGRGATYFPLALDEAPGFYKVVVRDMLTGIVSEWPVEVASAARSVSLSIEPGS